MAAKGTQRSQVHQLAELWREYVCFLGSFLFLLPRHCGKAKLENISDLPRKPLILFSHIPLSRPEGASCGPLREKGWIRAGRGAGYENTLSQATTNMLLETFRPSLVFRCASISEKNEAAVSWLNPVS